MGRKAAAIAGISANGLKWKHNLRLGTVSTRMGEIVTEGLPEENWEEFETLMKTFSKRFRALVESKGLLERMTFGEEEALDWLAEEPVVQENIECFEDGVEGFLEEFKFRMNELYDFADYERIVIT